MSRRVLLTGASGFIGSHVLAGLIERDDRVTCLASFRHRGHPKRIAALLRPTALVDVVTCDLAGPIPDLGPFDLILNLASDSHVDRSITDPVATIENNVSSTLSMVEYARRHPPHTFVQFSTDEVYGDARDEIDPFDTPLCPSNPYAASKAAQEMIVTAYRRTYGVPAVITNSSNVVGSGQDPEKFVPLVLDAIRRGRPVLIHTVDGVIGRRFWNPVENVVRALDSITKRAWPDGGPPPRFLLPGGEEHSNLDVAGMVADALGVPLDYRLVPVEGIRPGYDHRYSAFSRDGLDALYEFERVSLRTAIERIVKETP